ncbi:MAG: hypothetical protein AAGG51_13160 [Cyanobacteria bacterium P01_G01_bin.54]
MSSPEIIFKVAQTIYAELNPQHPLYGKLGDAISQLSAGQIESNDLVLLLARDESTRQRMAQLLEDSTPETTLQSKGFRFEPLAGQRQISIAHQYQCSQCDYTAYQRGRLLPKCLNSKCSKYGVDLKPMESN